MNLCEAKDRYQRDPHFKSVVDMMVAYALELEMSPGEMREAAVFAELRIQSMQPMSEMFPRRASEIGDEIRRYSLKQY